MLLAGVSFAWSVKSEHSKSPSESYLGSFLFFEPMATDASSDDDFPPRVGVAQPSTPLSMQTALSPMQRHAQSPVHQLPGRSSPSSSSAISPGRSLSGCPFTEIPPQFMPPPDAVRQFLQESEDALRQHGSENKKQKMTENLEMAPLVTVRVTAPSLHESSKSMGPFLQSCGLMDESTYRRTLDPRVSTSSKADVDQIPPFVVQAHTTSEYKKVIAGALSATDLQKFNMLPDELQETIVKMAMICRSCWSNLGHVVNDVHGTWWKVWAAASNEIRKPLSIGTTSLVVFIMRPSFGIPWLCLEKALLMWNQQMTDVQFRIAEVWVYHEDDAASMGVSAEVMSLNPMRSQIHVVSLPNPALFVHDVNQNMHSLKQHKWVSLMSLPLNIDKECGPHRPKPYSPHSFPYRLVWKWYEGLAALTKEMGAGSGINIMGSVANFLAPGLDFLMYMFGPVTTTNPKCLNRATRPMQFFTSPKTTSNPTIIMQSLHSPWKSTEPLPDGSVWMNQMQSTTKFEKQPPMLQPCYPKLLFQASTGETLDDVDVQYMGDLMLLDGSTQEPSHAGVSFLMNQMGFSGTALARAVNRYPCIVNFDIRNPAAPNAPPAYQTKCGKYCLCHNCRSLWEHLSSQWDMYSGSTIIFETIQNAVGLWRGQNMQSSFCPFMVQPHECDSECESNDYLLMDEKIRRCAM